MEAFSAYPFLCGSIPVNVLSLALLHDHTCPIRTFLRLSRFIERIRRGRWFGGSCPPHLRGRRRSWDASLCIFTADDRTPRSPSEVNSGRKAPCRSAHPLNLYALRNQFSANARRKMKSASPRSLNCAGRRSPIVSLSALSPNKPY